MSARQSVPEQAGSPPAQWPKPAAGPLNSTPLNTASPAGRTLACLGATLTIEGKITSEEDMQIDGKVQGPILLQGRTLVVGRTAEINSEITAGEVIVYGKVMGNLCIRDRVEIKTEGSVFGDITTSRISIEDGADFKGRIEIDRHKVETEDFSKSVKR